MALQWVFLALTQTRPHHSTTDPANMYQESMCVLSTLQCASTKGWGGWRLGAVMDYERQGNKHEHLHRQCIRESSELCLQSTGTESQHRSYLLQDSSFLLHESQFRERGKHILQGNREPQAQAQSFCSSNLPRPYPQ